MKNQIVKWNGTSYSRVYKKTTSRDKTPMSTRIRMTSFAAASRDTLLGLNSVLIPGLLVLVVSSMPSMPVSFLATFLVVTFVIVVSSMMAVLSWSFVF